jgi:hypothetical protein
MKPDLQGYAGQCTLDSLASRLLGQCSLGSPGFPPPPKRSYTGSGLLPVHPTLPLSSLFISHVLHTPYLPVLIWLGVSDWWLSLQPPAHAGSSLADFSTPKMEAIRSSETSVHTRSTRRPIPEDGILHLS